MKSQCLLLRLCTTVIFAFFFFDEVRGQCLEHHKSLLLKLKRSLVINEFILYRDGKSSNLAGWNSSTDCCSWPGVTCSGSYVTGLDLSNEGIVGGFNDSSSLFDLTSLVSLNLANMDYQTIIPSGIGRLGNLMYLNISRSYFTGQIPIEISNLTRLVSLDFSECLDLKAENPNLSMLVVNLSNLIDLRFNRVNLSSVSREWCQTLSSSTPRLQVLDLSYCALSGPIHDSLQSLTHLSTVDISFNSFSGPIPFGVFASLENLTSLTLKYCQFNGVFPHTMLQLPALQFLDMSQNYYLEASPSFTFRNSSLQTLILSQTRFSTTIPESIGEARMLYHLDLKLCNLSGQIPKSISQLEHLIYLDLSYNHMDGHIPSFSRSRNITVLNLEHNNLNGTILATSWEKLPQMASLILRWNSLSGSIPTCLFETPSLVKLDLKGNQFTGFTNESNVAASSSHLQELNIGDNDLQGPFPSFIYGLNSLQILDMSFNDFNDTFDIDSLRSSRDISRLDLSHSKLTVEIGNDFPSFSQLETLGLASCNLKEFPPFLTNQSRLWNLDLSDNQICGHIPDQIWNMSALLNLNISYNRLEVLGREELGMVLEIVDLSSNQLYGKLPSIQKGIKYLDLSGNLFKFIIPLNIISSLSDMRFLSFSSNKLHGSIPRSICNATNLEVLDFSNNFLSGTLPQCLTQNPNLGFLNLRKNYISCTIPNTSPSSCALQTLDLSQNSFQGEIPKSLGRCSSLKVLNLGFNKLHDMFPCWMNNVGKLTVLVLRSNSLYGSIQCLNHYSNWSMLQIIDIASNSFSGRLPSQGLLSWKAMLVDKKSTSTSNLYYQQSYPRYIFGKLRYLPMYFDNTVAVTVKGLKWDLTKISSLFTSVDLSHNKFEGDIPLELGELEFLYALNLSHNYLSGRVPSSFGNLYHIESLDLSKNELSGKIPEQLATLTFLSFLNLSYNHLEGMIPKGSQFQTFTKASFKGNEGLCGQPLSTSCGNDDVSNPPFEADDELRDGFKFSDIFIATEIGYALGLGLVIMPLLFWSRWRNEYYKCTDKILMSILCRRHKKSSLSQKIRRRN